MRERPEARLFNGRIGLRKGDSSHDSADEANHRRSAVAKKRRFRTDAASPPRRQPARGPDATRLPGETADLLGLLGRARQPTSNIATSTTLCRRPFMLRRERSEPRSTKGRAAHSVPATSPFEAARWAAPQGEAEPGARKEEDKFSLSTTNIKLKNYSKLLLFLI